jgi:hypothetical protein
MKPTVFFSHSSLDKDRLFPIRNHILEGTGNAIEIFMSSDGASIPFGKNWLSEIERALHDCRLMFVWVTPNSLRSNWIYFESGCAYSREIKVVPIGYDGIKLEELAPPLSILQGFNIVSPASLNNIVTIINREFGLTFPDLFDDHFYSVNVRDATSESTPELLEYVDGVTSMFHPKIQHADGRVAEIRPDWLGIFRRILIKKNIPFTEDGGKLFGLGYTIRTEKGDRSSWPAVDMDPLAIRRVWDILKDGAAELYEQGESTIALVVHENPRYVLPKDQSLIASRLVDTEVGFETSLPNVLFSYRNILFRVNIDHRYKLVGGQKQHEEKRELVLIVDVSNTDPIPLLSLMQLLIRRRVIHRVGRT